MSHKMGRAGNLKKEQSYQIVETKVAKKKANTLLVVFQEAI